LSFALFQSYAAIMQMTSLFYKADDQPKYDCRLVIIFDG